MAKMKTLDDAFLDEVRDAYDAEKQLLKALPKMASAASNPELKAAFESHLTETEGHVRRLEEAFGLLDETVRGKHCDGIAGIIEEGKKAIDENFEPATMDAVLIGGGQRAEHYEMAAYGTLIAWARTLGHDDVAELLDQNLSEEKAADEKLTALAEGGINDAAGDGTGDGEELAAVSDEKTPAAAHKSRK